MEFEASKMSYKISLYQASYNNNLFFSISLIKYGLEREFSVIRSIFLWNNFSRTSCNLKKLSVYFFIDIFFKSNEKNPDHFFG